MTDNTAVIIVTIFLLIPFSGFILVATIRMWRGDF